MAEELVNNWVAVNGLTTYEDNHLRGLWVRNPERCVLMYFKEPAFIRCWRKEIARRFLASISARQRLQIGLTIVIADNYHDWCAICGFIVYDTCLRCDQRRARMIHADDAARCWLLVGRTLLYDDIVRQIAAIIATMEVQE